MREYRHLALFSSSSGTSSEMAASFWRSLPASRTGRLFSFLYAAISAAQDMRSAKSFVSWLSISSMVLRDCSKFMIHYLL